MSNKLYRQHQILLLQDTKKNLDALIDNFITFVSGLLVRYTDKNGEIPTTATNTIKQQVRREFTKMMLGSLTIDGHLTPFMTQDKRVIPRSTYANLLWTYITKSTELGVSNQSLTLRKSLTEDQINSVKNNIPPLSEIEGLTLGHISPLNWIDPNGRKLTDRIWNTSGEVSRKLDRFLEINLLHRDIITTTTDDDEDNVETKIQAKSVANISKALVASGIFFGLQQLALNEVYRALVQADYAVAKINPIIHSYHPHTSPSHETVDECDQEEDGGPYQLDDSNHIPPFHVNCMCDVEFVTSDSIDATNYSNNVWILLFGVKYLVSALLNT